MGSRAVSGRRAIVLLRVERRVGTGASRGCAWGSSTTAQGRPSEGACDRQADAATATRPISSPTPCRRPTAPHLNLAQVPCYRFLGTPKEAEVRTPSEPYFSLPALSHVFLAKIKPKSKQ